LPVELERIVNKALEKDRKLRYQISSEMGVDLKRLKRELDSGHSGTPSVSAVTPSTVTMAPQRSRRRVAAFSVGAVIVGMALAYLLRPTIPPPKINGSTQITHDGSLKSILGQVAPTVLTDGPRLYVQENINGRFVIAQVSTTGGESVPIQDR
jgi:hypothetical protein